MAKMHLQVCSDVLGACMGLQSILGSPLASVAHAWTPKASAFYQLQVKELIPVVLAATTFDHQWSGRCS